MFFMSFEFWHGIEKKHVTPAGMKMVHGVSL